MSSSLPEFMRAFQRARGKEMSQIMGPGCAGEIADGIINAWLVQADVTRHRARTVTPALAGRQMIAPLRKTVCFLRGDASRPRGNRTAIQRVASCDERMPRVAVVWRVTSWLRVVLKVSLRNRLR